MKKEYNFYNLAKFSIKKTTTKPQYKTTNSSTIIY